MTKEEENKELYKDYTKHIDKWYQSPGYTIFYSQFIDVLKFLRKKKLLKNGRKGKRSQD